MRKLFLLAAVGFGLLAGCSKKEDATPDYKTFSNVGGTLAVSKNGAASYNLSNLQLRITHTSTSDVYEYRGLAGSGDGISIAFYLDPKRTGAGPYAASWAGVTYSGGFSGAQTNPEGGTGATYANPGPSATGKFSGTIYAGSLR